MIAQLRWLRYLRAAGAFLVLSMTMPVFAQIGCSTEVGGTKECRLPDQLPTRYEGGLGFVPCNPAPSPVLPHDSVYGMGAWSFASESEAIANKIQGINCYSNICSTTSLIRLHDYVELNRTYPWEGLQPIYSCASPTLYPSLNCLVGLEWTGEKRQGGVCVPDTDPYSIKASAPVSCPLGYTASLTSTPAPGRYLCTRDSQDNVCALGNPIKPFSGAKVFATTDFSEGALKFSRSYISDGFAVPYLGESAAHRLLGTHWLTRFDSRMFLTPSSAAVRAGMLFDDGTIKYFKADGTEAAHVAGSKAETLEENLDGTWTFVSRDDEVHLYSADARLLSIQDRSGAMVLLSYDGNGRLDEVIGDYGRSIAFSYAAVGNGMQTVSVTTPSGAVYVFMIDSVQNLTRVTYPDSSYRQYLYEDSSTVVHVKAITGIIDENGNRYQTVTYDNQGRATSSVLAPAIAGGTIGKHQFAYNGNGTTTVTNPLGSASILSFATSNGVTNFGGSTQPCASCGGSDSQSTTYDVSGFKNLVTDFNGNVTDYDYNTLGLEVSRIEARGMDTQPAARGVSDERKVETAWLSGFRVPTETRVYRCDAPNNTAQACTTVGSLRWALEGVTRFTHNARGQVTARCEVDPADGTAMSYTCGSSANAPTGVRQTATTYCDTVDLTAPDTIGSIGEDLGKGCPIVGLVRRIDGPRTDVDDWTTSEYRTADDGACVSSPTTCAYRKGDLWKQINALGHITEYVSYDGAGRVKRIKDSNAVLTDLTYHVRGWLQTRTVRHDPAGTPDGVNDAVTTLAYDNVGQVTRITQPGGAYIDYTYDHAHRLTAIEDNLGNSIEYTLDAAGNRVNEDTKDASPTLTRTLGRVYDSLGRLQKIVDANSEETVFTYDANGNQDTVTDALARVTDSDVDPLNRLIESTDALLGDTKYRYDARDNLVEVTDAEGLSTSYTFDGLGDQTQLVSPDTGTTAYTYDDAGNRITQTDARAVTSTYSYDELNRPTGIAYPTSSNDVAFTYDQNHGACAGGEQYGVGRMTGYTDPSGSTELCYDRRGNLKRKISVVNAVTLTTLWSYDLADRVSSMTYPSGTTVTHGRDGMGRITSIDVTPAGGSPTALISAVTYYPYGPVKQITWGNASTSLRNYDQNYWIDSIDGSQPSGLDLDFTLDEVGNIVAISDSIGGPPDNLLAYDALYRLTNVHAPGPVNVEQYSYDAIGNRLSKQVGAAAVQVYSYFSGTHRLESIDAIERQYDENGNTLKRDRYNNSVATFVYDEHNRFSAASRPSTSANYFYNAIGERVFKDVNALSKASRGFVYDVSGRMLAELDNMAGMRHDFIWLDNLPVGMIDDKLYVYYVQADHIGSPRKVIRKIDDEVIWSWPILGNPFGEALPDEDPDGDTDRFVFNLRFPGQYYDAEIALHYNYFRDYEANTGRYTESDPIGLMGGINTYSYALESPFGLSDPYGLDVKVCYYPSFPTHVGFGVVGDGNGNTSGFYPKPGAMNRAGAGSGLPVDGDVREDQPEDDMQCKIISSDEDADDCMRSCQKKRKNNPGKYHIVIRNCKNFVQDCLKECGLPSGGGWSPRPSDFFEDLQGM
jgi:RHS repeat-associated protein